MFQSLKSFAFFALLLMMPCSISGDTSVLSKPNRFKEGVQLQFQREAAAENELPPVSLHHQTFDDIEELIRSITESYASYGPQITADLKELLNKIAGRLTNALEKFQLLLLDASESVMRETFRSLEEQLLQLIDEFYSLGNVANEEFNGLIDYFNNTVINQTENIDLWANNLKQELRTANSSRLYKEGCQVVDAFIHQTTDELRNCCNIAIKPVYSLCRSVREMIIEALRVLADALERMQTCLEDKNSYLEYMMPCVHVAYDDVHALVKRAAQLRQRLTKIMPMKIVFSKFCILIVSVHMEQRQYKVEQSIDAQKESQES